MTKILTLLAVLTTSLSAQSPSTRSPLIDNEVVTVWDSRPDTLPDAAVLAQHDTVVVYIAPESLQGKVEYVPHGGDATAAIGKAHATRAAIISLKRAPQPPLPNTSGYPNAFPRPGKLSTPLNNAQVIVWDYTFERGKPSPMHFHPRDVVTVYLKEGALVATTPDGVKTDNEFTPGTIRFNPRNRTHSEVVVRGESRIVSVELK
jgi:quercetin dioxygenase-like cupin family protein